MSNLADRVEAHYVQCLGVNASWREFTSQLALLSTFGILNDDDFEFVVELFLEEDDFEDEDPEELTEAIGLFLEGRKIPVASIDAAMLGQTYSEYGYSVDQFAEFARDAGVPEEVIESFVADEEDC